MSDLINTRIDRYLIQERIGSGGMARVFRAHDTNLDRPVAIKILHEHLADDPTFKERFEREAKLVASLNHPNIVQVYDFNAVTRDGFPMYYMVMSFVSGKTLRTLLEERAAAGEPLSQTRALELIAGVANALGYAHALGMAHRDVKPANIIINEAGQAVLTDFGIARMMESSRLTVDGYSTGTPAYMSPEQATGLPGDPRSDLYALGAILFEMLSGHPPYGDEGGLSLMLKHLNAPVPAVSPHLATDNPALDAFMQKAMAKNPDDRYQSAQAFADDRGAGVTGASRPPPLAPAEPPPSGGPTETLQAPSTAGAVEETWSHRRIPLPAILALGVLVIVLAGVVAFGGLGASPDNDTPTQSGSDTGSQPVSSGGALYFTSGFDEDDEYRNNWIQGSLGGVLQEMTSDGFYRLRSERLATATTSIFNPDYVYSSVSIAMAGTLEPESSPEGAYGIAFNYRDQEHYNVFAVDGRGRYSIWVRDNGAWRELRETEENWTAHPAINPIGERNALTLDIMGSFFTGYVNGQQVVRVSDDTFSNGNIGIYLATHSEGVTSVLVDYYQTYPAAPPSMTGG